MIEIQGLQTIGWLLFIVVTGYSIWVAVLFEKNKKHQHTILSLLEKLQGFENEVDQYRSTVKDQMLLIARLNQEIQNLKNEPLTLEKAYKEAMRQLNDVSIERDEYHDMAVSLYCQKHGMKTAIDVAEELDKIAISPVSLETVKKCKEVHVGAALFPTSYQKDAILGIIRDTCEKIIVGWLPEEASAVWSYKIYNEDDLSAD